MDDIPLTTHKLTLPSKEASANFREQIYVALLLAGSFNPPTFMHLRMFELAKDALKARGYVVIGGYISPVNDAYKKKGLLLAKHRIQMCELACKTSSFVMVDPWEAKQTSYQRSLTVLSRIESSILQSGLIRKESLKVMLLCGSDLLESFGIPGVWIPDQVGNRSSEFHPEVRRVRREGSYIYEEFMPTGGTDVKIRTICKDFGIVCIRREGKDIEKIISSSEILLEFKNNIVSVDEIVPNQISSTKVRDCIAQGLSVKYLIADEIIDYIEDQKLYLNSKDG